jgi:putative membrane protein
VTKTISYGALMALLVFTLPVAWAQAGQTRNPNAQITGGPKHSSTSKNPNDPENRNDPQHKNSGSLSSADKQFLTNAAQGGLAEVVLGKLAQQKANDQAVKQFGQRMEQDHTKANDELKSLAAKKGVQLSTSLKHEDQIQKDELSKLPPQSFDTHYMQVMVKDHQKDVSEFQKAADGASDPDVKNFAQKTLPILQDHLKQAQQDQKKVAGGGR